MKQLKDYKLEEFGANKDEINSLIMEKASDCAVAKMEEANKLSFEEFVMADEEEEAGGGTATRYKEKFQEQYNKFYDEEYERIAKEIGYDLNATDGICKTSNKQNSVICTTCGNFDVLCEAIINPNTKEFEKYVDESFQYGWCNICKTGKILTDTNEVKNEIDNAFRQFCEKNGCEPRYAICTVTWKNDNGCEDVKIKMSVDIGEDDVFFFYCYSLPNLKTLCDYGNEDFIVTELISFEK